MRVYEDLLRVIRKHTGSSDDEIRTTATNGGQGFEGFMWFEDTDRFYLNNEDKIWDLLWEESQLSGESSVIESMATWRCSKVLNTATQFRHWVSIAVLESIGRYLEGKDNEND